MGQRGENYFILLILTDGIITDMPQTCEAIVNVSVCRLNEVYVCGLMTRFESKMIYYHLNMVFQFLKIV